jgi:hypothetical protein
MSDDGGVTEGCTSCGNKGGCDDRKGGMFGAIDEALGRLYPTQRWDDRDDAVAFRAGVPPSVSEQLARRVSEQLKTLTLLKAGGTDEYCDYLYVLCFGRQPSILELREGVVGADQVWSEAADGKIDELHLRVALSSVAPFAAVQQVTLSVSTDEDHLIISETPRTGVFDPPLLPRMQKLVAVLAELNLRHLDFGDLTQPPPGFEPGDYARKYGGEPTMANYFFYPQPASAVTTTMLPRQTAVRSP